jgi:putative tryptophan/tyrosine transport system substrate-binding protein
VTYVLKRVALGLLLIAAASVILLVADRTPAYRDPPPHEQPDPKPGAAELPLSKTWRLSLIELNRVADVEDAERGVLDGLKEAGLVEGRDYRYTIRNAQGDMATVSGLVDAAARESDLLITFSTPTLQAAMQRVKQLPIVFNYVGDPIAAGAGTTNESHRPNVTGTYLVGAYDQMLPLIRNYLPNARVLGTVYVPAEVNMVSQKEVMEKAARHEGFELRAVAANAPGEIADAALALVAGRVDAICQLPGNLTASGFPAIAQAARRARVPIFGFMSSQARDSVLTLARDYYDSGREAAKLAARIMRGESPARLPFMGMSDVQIVVNHAAARAVGLTSPAAVVAKAQQVIDH